jgi:hypothetical protein
MIFYKLKEPEFDIKFNELKKFTLIKNILRMINFLKIYSFLLQL